MDISSHFKRSAMLPNTPLRTPVFHILLALAEDDLHGLGIADSVEDASGGSVVLGPGTLYRSLKEMTAQALVVEVAAPRDADPRRRYYRISALGRAALSEEIGRMDRLVALARRRRIPEPSA